MSSKLVEMSVKLIEMYTRTRITKHFAQIVKNFGEKTRKIETKYF